MRRCGIILTTMDALDPAGEFLRISERYRQMSDEEILVLIPQSSELTPFAQQALANEVRQRGLRSEVEVEAEEPSASSQFEASRVKRPPVSFEHEFSKFRDSAGDDFPNADSSHDRDSSSDADSYEEDRKLIDLCTVWSLREALKVKMILDGLGIPFFMGPERATGVDGVTSFANGISVQIMQIGLPWAGPARRHYEPTDDPNRKEDEELDELAVRCPKCHSAEVVFEGGTSTLVVATDDSSQKYKWTCDSCGHQWEDDGIAQEE
jgi:DNA-directed RNA polymerase subunit M/transcription elongation factor TFIIS